MTVARKLKISPNVMTRWRFEFLHRLTVAHLTIPPSSIIQTHSPHFYSEDSKWTCFDMPLAVQKHSHSEINLECVDRIWGQSSFSLSSWPNDFEGSSVFIRIRMSKALRDLYFSSHLFDVFQKSTGHYEFCLISLTIYSWRGVQDQQFQHYYI